MNVETRVYRAIAELNEAMALIYSHEPPGGSPTGGFCVARLWEAVYILENLRGNGIPSIVDRAAAKRAAETISENL